MIWLGIILIIVSLVVFVNATEKVKYGEFAHVSWWLLSLGIYQWGQGLIVSFFWILYGLMCLFWWTPSQALSAYIVFHVVRAGVELLLCLSGSYGGLLDDGVKHDGKLSNNERLQLYYLGQGIIMICGLLLLPYIPIK